MSQLRVVLLKNVHKFLHSIFSRIKWVQQAGVCEFSLPVTKICEKKNIVVLACQFIVPWYYLPELGAVSWHDSAKAFQPLAIFLKIMDSPAKLLITQMFFIEP